jgi:chaperonin GroES
MAPTSVTTTFIPLHDRILVRRLEAGESVRGGIIIPDSAKEKPQEGEVISVGKGKSNDEGKVFPLDVKAGDKILFGKYSGTEIKIDGEELLIMREEEVLHRGQEKPRPMMPEDRVTFSGALLRVRLLQGKARETN